MKKLFILLAAALVSGVAYSQSATVAGPDGKLVLNVYEDAGKVSYTLTYDGSTVFEKSPLGLKTSTGDFDNGLVSAGTTTRKIDENYTMPMGKQREVHYLANELVCKYTTPSKDVIEMIFRLSNNDLALRYRIDSPSKKNTVILSESTGFDFPSYATTWICPQSDVMVGFARTKPSYEEEYTRDQPVGTRSAFGHGYTFPCLFRLGNDGWALISETGVDSSYPGTRLSDSTPEGLYTVAFPMEGENKGLGITGANTMFPAYTSWKTVTVGKSLAPIVESNVATDVVEPLYEAKYDYVPGGATWSWILWQDNSMNWDDQVKFIDLASEAGLQYILIDALWDTNIGYERMAELVKYAAGKGVGCLLWYNSNGAWNDAPQGPRGKLDKAPARQKEFAWLQSIGVKGLKIDFFGGDKQETIKLYEDILTDANNYELMIVFHGCTLPRGWSRMYPNFIGSEAVLASENLVFGQRSADLAALNSTIIPFVRNAVAPMDYGPVFLSPRYSSSDTRGTTRRTTDAYELATAVNYFCPIQHFGLVPKDLERQPEYVINFLRDVPKVWDETRLVGGYPGDNCVIARRSGDKWYVGATNGKEETRKLEISLPMMAGKKAVMYYDTEDRKAGKKEVKIARDGKLTLDLASNGGAVIVFEGK